MKREQDSQETLELEGRGSLLSSRGVEDTSSDVGDVESSVRLSRDVKVLRDELWEHLVEGGEELVEV
jgi:hypothetical protein